MSAKANDKPLPDLTEQAINWLVRLHADDLSDEETCAFADWLSQDVSHTAAFAEAEDLFKDMVTVGEVLSARSTAVVDPGQTKASRAMGNGIRLKPPANNKKPQKLRHWLAWPIGLAAAWLFAVLLVMPRQAHWLDAFLSDYHTQTGEQREIQLADGSRLLLNTNTAVSMNYQDEIRLIKLHHGQARFTVAKDTKRPFEVHSDGLSVRALGTMFDVYNPETGDIRVTVQEHAVSARLLAEDNPGLNESNPAVLVNAGQQLHYRDGLTLPAPQNSDISQLTAWQQRRLFINNRPLSELIEELNRYRSGRIFLSDADLGNLRVTGVFSLANPEDTLHKISVGLALQSTRLGSWWVVLHR
jgi:transmembrane sensor